MASITKASAHRRLHHLHKKTTTSIHSFFPLLHFPSHTSSINPAPNSSSSPAFLQCRFGIHVLKRPHVFPPDDEEEDEAEEVKCEQEAKNKDQKEGESYWKALEDQILEDAVPIFNIVRTILHSNQYGSGERLNPEHEKMIVERLLPYHPRYEGKIGCGIDYIIVGNHPEFENSRCLFIVRKDGEVVDFSYWKCIKGLVRANYPLVTDGYIFRQIRQQSRDE